MFRLKLDVRAPRKADYDVALPRRSLRTARFMSERPLRRVLDPHLDARSWLVGEQMRRQPAESIKSLHLGLLGDLQRIVNLNSEVAHRAFQLGVAEQQLHYPKILCSSVDQ